jgi:hypothetical protein
MHRLAETVGLLWNGLRVVEVVSVFMTGLTTMFTSLNKDPKIFHEQSLLLFLRFVFFLCLLVGN